MQSHLYSIYVCTLFHKGGGIGGARGAIAPPLFDEININGSTVSFVLETILTIEEETMVSRKNAKA